MTYPLSGSLQTQLPSRSVTAALLGTALAGIDIVVALLVAPIPLILLLAPLLVPGDRIDLGFALIDTAREAWLAAIPGTLLVLGIGYLGAKVIKRQRAWIIGQVASTPTSADREPASPHGLAGFTAREVQVLELMSRGLTNGAIAQELVISESTVRKHVGRIFTKLDLDTDNSNGNDRRVTAVLAYVQHANRESPTTADMSIASVNGRVRRPFR